jgi:hypothetical protein
MRLIPIIHYKFHESNMNFVKMIIIYAVSIDIFCF